MTFGPLAKFVRSFGDAAEQMREGLEQYRSAVLDRSFPSDEESYHLSAEAASGLEKLAAPVSLAS
jgi:3-methyl-2-oxobutanoate hydroxymethyltransferase